MDKSKELNIIADNVVTYINNKFRCDNIPQELLNYLYLTVYGLNISLGVDAVDDVFNEKGKVPLHFKIYHLYCVIGGAL